MKLLKTRHWSKRLEDSIKSKREARLRLVSVPSLSKVEAWKEASAESVGRSYGRAMGAHRYGLAVPYTMGPPRWSQNKEHQKMERVLACINTELRAKSQIERLAFAKGWIEQEKNLGATGLAGLWLATALEKDDEIELLNLLDRGCDPWALCIGGWHPLDWAWLVNARKCAPVIASHVCGQERASSKEWDADKSKREKVLLLSGIVIVNVAKHSGFESQVPILCNMWGRGGLDTYPSTGSLRGKLSIMGRIIPEMAESEPKCDGPTAMAWWLSVTVSPSQRAWVESILIGPSARSGVTSEAHRL